MKPVCLAALVAASLLAACGDDSPASPDAATADAPVVSPDAAPPPDADPDAAPLPPASGVDILFVVDNSGSMQEEQQALAGAFLDDFLGALEAAHGSRPDLHIGVISTNMGAGPYQISGCAGAGDSGTLRVGGPSGCPGLTEAYLSDVSDGEGGRTVNYEGTIGEVFSCQAQLGIDGCGFEQPLASLRAALDPGHLGNAGFLRDGAALAIVFLGDEDDCSADDTAVYDTSQNEPSDPLGPLSSFRCFEFGVVCAPDEPRAPGVKQGCTVRTGSYLTDPVAVADAVKAIRPAGHVAVAVITGDVTPIEVEPDPEQPQRPALAPSCESPDGRAYPGIRLHAFAGEFAATSTTGSICTSFTTPLGALAQEIAGML